MAGGTAPLSWISNRSTRPLQRATRVFAAQTWIAVDDLTCRLQAAHYGLGQHRQPDASIQLAVPVLWTRTSSRQTAWVSVMTGAIRGDVPAERVERSSRTFWPTTYTAAAPERPASDYHR
jgi:hypothetical protein